MRLSTLSQASRVGGVLSRDLPRCPGRVSRWEGTGRTELGFEPVEQELQAVSARNVACEGQIAAQCVTSEVVAVRLPIGEEDVVEHPATL